jgi:hypothetical protein
MGPQMMLLASQVLPDLIRVLAGDRSDSVRNQVVEAIRTATGTDDPEAARAKIEADPQARAQLQKDLAGIALEETKEQNRANEEAQRIDLELNRLQSEERERAREDEFRQYLRDLQDRQEARSMETTLAEEHNPLAWVAPIMAFGLVLLIFYLLRGIMEAREEVVNKDVFNVVLGALVTAFTTVVAYYFGSSIGSTKKDDALRSGQLMTSPKAGRDGKGDRSPQNGSDEDVPRQAGARGDAKPKAPAAGPAPTGELGLFRQRAPAIMRDLMRDLSLTTVQAAGILGNIGHECAGFRLLQEQKPIRGGRGGWGWCQWTGPRRTEFENWATEKGYDYSSYEANYGFLLRELRGSQADSIRRLKEAQTVDSATTDFMNTFERPAAQYAGLSNRVRLSKLALQDFERAYDVHTA